MSESFTKSSDITISNRMKKKHIDDAQPSTVAEHFQLLMEDKSVIQYSTAVDLTADDLPEWFDEQLFKKTQNYYLKNIASMALVTLTGLIMVLSVPDILKILVFSNNSHTACLAYKRYYRTIFYTNDVYLFNPLDSSSNFYKMLNTIRSKHLSNSKRAEKAGMEGIYHKDMAITQYGFIGTVLIKPTLVGLYNTPEEEEAITHFWRVVGHMLGISDRLNICRKNAEETRQLCEMIKVQFAKYLNNPPPHFEHMSEVAVNGMWYGNILLNYNFAMKFTHKLVDSEYKKPLNWQSWLNLKYNEMILYLRSVPFIGTLTRLYNNALVWTSYWFVRKFSFLAWITFGKDQTQIHLYSVNKST